MTDYQPAGGPGDKVFPPTYEGGKYATEERVNPQTGEIRQCVLLDSVQSQANRMELALLEAHRSGKVKLPLLVIRFDQDELLKKFAVTSLEAPHRAADALFRDSLLNGTIFRKSEKGRILDTTEVRNATGLFGLCPTALVFGLWDSTGPRGGLGCKFQRAVVSEIVGYDAKEGKKTSSRIDPAEIRLGAGPLYERSSAEHNTPDWTLDADSALVEKSKPKPFGKKPNTRKAVGRCSRKRDADHCGRRIYDLQCPADDNLVSDCLAPSPFSAQRRRGTPTTILICGAHGAGGARPGCRYSGAS